jgi:8-oxo-dGTP pyrophosphatase MutT (NUDIX family)
MASGNALNMVRRTGVRGKVTIGVQAVVVDATRRILLVRHGYRPGWHFPGGGVERSETISEAIVRELHEETGIIAHSAPEVFAIYSHFDAFPGDHIILMRIPRWHQPHVPPPNREIADQGFFTPDRLPVETTEQTRRRIREISGACPIRPAW